MGRRTLALTTLLALLVPFLAGSRAAPVAAQESLRGRDLEKALIRLAEHAVPRTAVVYGAIGLGSGAVVDADGTTVTNAHVGLLARVAILEFADGRKVKAKRRGMDLERDLAIYEPVEKVEGPVPCFELGRERPKAGTWLVALGYPGGPRGDLRPTISLGQAVTGGGLPGPVRGVLRYDDAVRTDIAIFSGNSGGPLLDLEGRLLGINGAMEIGTGAAFAVPIDIVKDRLATLEKGAIRLPGGRVISGTGVLARALDKAIDPMIERLVDRVKEGFDPAPKLEIPLPKLELTKGRDELAKRLRETPREKALRDELAAHAPRELAVRLGDEHFATRVDAKHLVAKASFLEGKKDWRVGEHGKAHVVAEDAANDLALLELDSPSEKGLVEDAPSRPAGSLCAAVGPDGLLAAGIVSVGPREIPEAVSARIAAGGLAAPVIQALRRVAELVPPLKDSLEPIISQLEAQEALNAGNEPRGYARVLSHDAPLAPSEAGAPLVDLDGRLVGVNVSNANYGTSYAVPIATIRETFGLAARPIRGKVKLY